MADELNVLELNGGVPLDDPTSGILYITKGGLDYPIEYETLFDFIYRANMSESCDGSVGQVISYSTTFLNVKPRIIDFEGIGIEVTAYDEDGFTITSLSSGTFGYLTIKDK